MKPLAQDYTLVARSPEPLLFCFEPGIMKLPSGRLLVTFPYLSPLRRRPPGYTPPLELPHLNLRASDDRGKTWHDLQPRPWTVGKPIVQDGALYLLGTYPGRRHLVISRSDDEGDTWSPHSCLLKGRYWNCPTGHALSGNRFYWALGVESGDEVAGNVAIARRGRATIAIAADLGGDLLDPASWRRSNPLPFPGVPPELVRYGKPGVALWLEPNVVAVQGRILVISTVKIFSAEGSQTPGIAAVGEVEDDGRAMRYRFVQYYPTPGGQLKFSILWDDVSGLFWRTMNLPASAAAAEWGDTGPGDRRMLCLSYSLDALNWMTAGCIALTPNAWEGFQYAQPCIDGDDLLVIARTSLNEENQHDANTITLHRIRQFRALVLDGYRPNFERPS